MRRLLPCLLRRRWSIILFAALVCLIAAPLTFAQAKDAPDTNPDNTKTTQSAPAEPSIPARFKSPLRTLMTFVEAMNRAAAGEDDAWNDAFDCFEFDTKNRERAKDTATEFWGILNRLEVIDQASNVPNVDVVKREGMTRYVYFPDDRFEAEAPEVMQLAESAGRIELVLTKGGWKVSSESLDDITAIYAKVSDLDTVGYLENETKQNYALWLRSQMPEWARETFFNVAIYSWIGLLIIAFVGFVVDHLLRMILRAIANRSIEKQRARAREETIRNTVRPIGLVAAALIWLTLLRLLNLPVDALNVLLIAVRVFMVLAVTWAAWRFTDLICEVLASKASRTATKFDDVLVPLIRKSIKVFIVAIGLIYGASSLNINIVPMLTGLGIGGLAFAFAAKDTIENFFGSVAVILDRTFEVGDWVVIEDVEGTVEEVGFRSTRVRTFYNSLVTVPNATLVRAKVDNYGKRKYRRFKSSVGVQYDTSPEKLLAFTEGIREIIRSHPYTRKDYFQVWFNNMGPSSLDVLLYVFHETPDWTTELRERERMLLDIMRLADNLGVQFAFPTQTLHLFQEEKGSEHLPSESPGRTTDRRSMIEGIRAAQNVMEKQPWQEAPPGPVKFSAGPTKFSDDGADGEDGGDETFVEDRTAGS